MIAMVRRGSQSALYNRTSKIVSDAWSARAVALRSACVNWATMPACALASRSAFASVSRSACGLASRSACVLASR